MLFVAIWCRDLDNLVGLKSNSLPWHIKSDLKRFKNITKDKIILVGRNTYNSLPNRTLPNRKILVLTENPNKSFLSEQENHFFVSLNDKNLNCENFEISNKIIYICGGAMIYDLFLSSKNLLPEVIIDSVYQKNHPDFKEKGVFLSDFTDEILLENYEKEFISNEENVITYIWRRKESKKNVDELYNQIKKDAGGEV